MTTNSLQNRSSSAFQLIVALAAMIAFWIAGPAQAGDNVVEYATAASGYDVVAYHTEGKAKVGSTDNFTYHNGKAYLFSSKKNKEMFMKNPSKYEPAFNGFCAMGVAMGKKLPVDPKAFKIVDGVLYLNLNKDVQKFWMDDMATNIDTANEKWSGIKHKNPADL